MPVDPATATAALSAVGGLFGGGNATPENFSGWADGGFRGDFLVPFQGGDQVVYGGGASSSQLRFVPSENPDQIGSEDYLRRLVTGDPLPTELGGVSTGALIVGAMGVVILVLLIRRI
jgi:hypothetical protein